MKAKSTGYAYVLLILTGLVLAACNRGTANDPNPGDRIVSASGIEMAWIPAGTFTMGSPSAEKGRTELEEPQHLVTLTKGFYMSVYQVTQEQFETVMGRNPSFFSEDPADDEIQAKRPVDTVNWYEALVFCNRLSIMDGLTPAYRIGGKTAPDAWGAIPTDSNAAWDAVTITARSTGYRLPTEAQWEYACRAGTTTAFNDGTNDWEDAEAIDLLAWTRNNSGRHTRETGKKTPNEWGLYDMHGNVWEWCWNREYDYPGSTQTNPMENPTRQITENYRALRGGVCFYPAQFARSAERRFDTPFDWHNGYGFRVIRPFPGSRF